MKIVVCTSMSAKGYEEYGKRFWDSFVEFWPRPITLMVYTEDYDILTEKKRWWVYIINLNSVWDRSLKKYTESDLKKFLSICPPDTSDYRSCAAKFAHKVFAYTDPNRPGCDWWIWLDADTETFKPVDEEWIKQALPRIAFTGFQDDEICSYLGRKDWNASETGWLAFNTKLADPFLKRMREVYTSGEIFDHLEWCDGYIFDRVREEFEAEGHKFRNLSAEVPGMHPWPETMLGQRMKHYKGPLRKKGSHPEGLPSEYWSEKEHEQRT